MQIKTTYDCHINGLGTFKAGEWTDLSKAQMKKFEFLTGTKIKDIESPVIETRVKKKSTTKKEGS